MMSYFLIKSQCGWAFACILGNEPQVKTTSFSSAVFPSGTELCGRLGSVTNKSSICFSAAFAASSFSFMVPFKAAVSARLPSANSFWPDCMSEPISFAAAFDVSNADSACCNKLLRWSSMAIN